MTFDPSLRHVLVVAYYFPPMGLSGVQRVTKFVKYLPEYGWHPTVLTVEPGGYFAYDQSLLREVAKEGVQIYRATSWDPSRLFGNHQTVNLPPEPRRKWYSMLSQFVFVPDNKIGWMPNALRLGRKLLREHRFDAIFSSAPPYSAHLIAGRLSRWSGIPLLVDFRDDWVGNPRHVYPTPLHRRMHRDLERRVIRTSRHVITINEQIRHELAERHPMREDEISVIPQGFDAEDFERHVVSRSTNTLRFLYCGIFYDAQTPDFFLKALARMVEQDPALRNHIEAVFVGLLPESSWFLISKLGIGDLVKYEGYVSHDEAVEQQVKADVLWMTIGKRPGAEGISTGKLYEYIGVRKPILALVPEGAAKETLEPYGAAWVVEPDDVRAIEKTLAVIVQRWKAGTLPVANETYVRQFERRRLTGRLAALLARSTAGTD
ncbi:MAG: glycosyltransferase family 4 protein [Rhodothermales bacterium]